MIMMKRIACAVVLGGVVLGGVVGVVALRAQAGGGLAGSWTVQLFEQGTEFTYWIAKLQDQQGKLSGTVEIADEEPPATLHDVRLEEDLLSFTIKERSKGGFALYAFQGKIPEAGANTIWGSISVGSGMVPARFERTTLTDLKGRKKARQVMAKAPKTRDIETLKKLRNDPFLFIVGHLMFRDATENKAEPAQVAAWYDIVAGAAAPYGPRWQRHVALRTAETLSGEKGYAAVAERAARQALNDTAADKDGKLRALTALATALRQEGKEEYAKVAASLEALEGEAYVEYGKHALPFKPDTFGGRKDKSKPPVLVELFTGAQCPPCVAADMAFDALARTYTPNEVVLLQYHEHIPGPDPLANADTRARMDYYEAEGTPSLFFNGKPAPGDASGGGPPEAAQEYYQEYRKVIARLLENPATVKLEADAVRKGDQIHITATASGLDKPGEKVRLRLALVEDWVRYRGGNGLPYHHRVVRDMPGGPEGLALTSGMGKQEATVDLPKLRAKLANYLDDFAKKEEVQFPSSYRPLRLRDLRVVAFVQNDETKEVLQAVEVPVRGTGGN